MQPNSINCSDQKNLKQMRIMGNMKLLSKEQVSTTKVRNTLKEMKDVEKTIISKSELQELKRLKNENDR